MSYRQFNLLDFLGRQRPLLGRFWLLKAMKQLLSNAQIHHLGRTNKGSGLVGIT